MQGQIYTFSELEHNLEIIKEKKITGKPIAAFTLNILNSHREKVINDTQKNWLIEETKEYIKNPVISLPGEENTT